MKNIWMKLIEFLEGNAHKVEEPMRWFHDLQRLDQMFLDLDDSMRSYRAELVDMLATATRELNIVSENKCLILKLTADIHHALVGGQRDVAFQLTGELLQIKLVIAAADKRVMRFINDVSYFGYKLSVAERTLELYKYQAVTVRIAVDVAGYLPQVSFDTLKEDLDDLCESHRCVHTQFQAPGKYNAVNIDEKLFNDVHTTLTSGNTEEFLERIERATSLGPEPGFPAHA